MLLCFITSDEGVTASDWGPYYFSLGYCSHRFLIFLSSWHLWSDWKHFLIERKLLSFYFFLSWDLKTLVLELASESGYWRVFWFFFNCVCVYVGLCMCGAVWRSETGLFKSLPPRGFWGLDSVTELGSRSPLPSAISAALLLEFLGQEPCLWQSRQARLPHTGHSPPISEAKGGDKLIPCGLIGNRN